MVNSESQNKPEKRAEPEDADSHTPVADLHPVVTPEGLGYVAVGGRVYAWDPQDQKWAQSQTEDIKQLKLGADYRLYALTGDNVLVTLDSAGEPAVDRPPIQLPRGVRDFAVSPMGRIAFVDEDPKARIAFVDPASAADQSAKPIRGNSPLADATSPNPEHALRSLAFAQDGSLSVLDHTGTIWEGSRPTNNPNLNWVPVRAALSEKIAAYNKLERLVTLRSGSVGAVDQKQNILERSHRMWRPINFGEQRAVDAFYERVENLNTGTGQKWYVPAIFHREATGPDLATRWRNWAKSHQPIQQTKGVYANASQALRDELTNARNKLSNLKDLPKLEDLPWKTGEAFEKQIANKVTDNAKTILDTLEQELGTRNPDGTINHKFRNKRVQASPATVNSDENVIRQLYDVRRAIHGKEDDVTARLKNLLDRNVFLPLDSKRLKVDTEESSLTARGHLVKNKYGVLTGKLMHDHALLAETAKATADPDNRLSMDEIHHRSQLIDGRNEQNENNISTLYKANFVNLDRVDRYLETFDNITTGLTDRDNKFHRSATAQSVMGQKTIDEAYVDNFFPGMKSDEKISLQMSKGGMLNLFGLSALVKPIIPLVQVQGFLEASAMETYGLELTKTEDGVKVSLNKATEVAATPLGFRIRAGLFGSERFAAIAQVFGYAGVQNIYKVGVVKNFDNVTTFTIKQDDHGRLQGALRGLFAGTISPYELMAVSEEMRNKRDVKLTTTATANIEAGIGAGGGGTSANATSQAKHTLAPAAERFIVGAQWESGKSSERGPGNASVNKRISQGEMFVKATHVTDVPGFEQQIDKDLWGKSVANDGYSLNVGEQGDIDSVTVEVQPKRLPIKTWLGKLRGETSNNFLSAKQIPQLGVLLKTNPELHAHIDKLRSSDLPLKIAMELTPAATDKVRQYIVDKGKRPGDKDVSKYIKELAAKPENLRITKISATQETTYTTGWLAVVPVVGYQSTATNTFHRSRANIQVNYAGNGEKPKLQVRGDLLLGPETLPDFSQVNKILRDIDPARYRFLNDPVGNDPVRQQLAQLTDSPGSNQGEATEKLFSSRELDRDGVGLLHGRLVFIKQSDDGAHRVVNLPDDVSSRIVGQLGRSVLGPMSQGQTGTLRNENLPLTHDDLSRLKQLATDPATPQATHESVEKNPDRPLTINGIIDGLRNGHLPKLDPAQEIILTQFFPAKNGGLDLRELGRLLDDHAQVERFQTSIRKFASSANPSIARDNNGQHNSPSPPAYEEELAEVPVYTEEPTRNMETRLSFVPPAASRRFGVLLDNPDLQLPPEYTRPTSTSTTEIKIPVAEKHLDQQETKPLVLAPLKQLKSSVQPDVAQTEAPQLKPVALETVDVPVAAPAPTPGFGQVKKRAQEFEREVDINIVLDRISGENPKLKPPGQIMDAERGDALDRMPGFKASEGSKVMHLNANTGDAYVWIPPASGLVKRKADVYIVNAALQDEMLGPGKRLMTDQSTAGMRAGIKVQQEIEPSVPTRSSSKSRRF